VLGRINETCKGWNDLVPRDIHAYKHCHLWPIAWFGLFD
jgi:hypothetical protein